MRTHKTLLGLASIAGLLIGAQLALADDATPAPSPPPMPGRAFCKENPGKCEEQRAQMKARRAEMKEKCAADPAKCEEMKQQMRERFHERHGSGPSPAQ